MVATAMAHVCVDENIKAHATETLEAMGLTDFDTIRGYLTSVAVERQLLVALRCRMLQLALQWIRLEALVRHGLRSEKS